MWQSLFSFTKSWAWHAEDTVADAVAPAVVVTAAPPPSFQVDPVTHAQHVRFIQTRSSRSRSRSRSRSPVPTSPRTPFSEPVSAPHPYALAHAPVAGYLADTINTLMDELLEGSQRASLLVDGAAAPVPPLPPLRAPPSPWRPAPSVRFHDEASADTSFLAEQGQAASDVLCDRTRPFVNYTGDSALREEESVVCVHARSDDHRHAWASFPWHELAGREEAQRGAIAQAEAHCWRSLSETLVYVCGVLATSTHKAAVPLHCGAPTASPRPSPRPLSSLAPLWSVHDSHTPRGRGSSLARSWTHGSSPVGARPTPHGRDTPAHDHEAHPYAVRAPTRPFLHERALNVPLPIKAAATTTTPPRCAVRRAPLLSPPRPRQQSDDDGVLLSPPAPPRLTRPSAVVLHEDEAAVAWVPVTRDAHGQLRVAWGAWDTAASASGGASVGAWSRAPSPPSARHPYSTLDDDERAPTVEVSVLSTRTDGQRPPPPPAARRPFITVLDHRASASPLLEALLDATRSEEEEEEDRSHSPVLRIDASEISTLDLSVAQVARWAGDEVDGDDDHALGILPAPVRFYNGTAVYSL